MSQPTQPQPRRKPGPARLTAVPASLREIPGIMHLTTHRQLRRLREYLETPPARRAPFVRLGASVPQFALYPEARPSATYAVFFDGRVEVVRRDQDPRQVEKWMANPMRPWNLEAEFADLEVAQ
ncbi:MAG: hypothetical protein RLY93_12180 [Sumerlaeia bacterium]